MGGKHYALLAGFLGALGLQISSVHSWSELLTPAFIGGVIIQVGTFLGALYADKPVTNLTGNRP